MSESWSPTRLCSAAAPGWNQAVESEVAGRRRRWLIAVIKCIYGISGSFLMSSPVWGGGVEPRSGELRYSPTFPVTFLKTMAIVKAISTTCTRGRVRASIRISATIQMRNNNMWLPQTNTSRKHGGLFMIFKMGWLSSHSFSWMWSRALISARTPKRHSSLLCCANEPENAF